MPEFDHATPVTVSLRLHRGEADVFAEPRETVRVDITEGGADASESFTVRLEGDTLIVHAPDTALWQWRRYPKVRIVIRVPEGSSLAMKSAAADIRAAGRYATVQGSLQSADAEVDRVDGDAQLKAASGDLKVVHVGGSLRLSSSSGDIEVGDVIGDVSADTASGDITIRAAGASVQAESASGDVEVGLLRRGKARLKTASGDVSVGVAAGTGVWLDLSTSSGSTSNGLSMGATPTGDQQATLELGIRTASGDIDVHRAAA
ncbi:DUF4097 family beta strand repeat-containing protein [Actinoplanes sp. NPDC049118]|uniref:DUF4097 family beta strand repeat-containing protein n=1 Tax=Actinoplanes sp. NPDC049118 TaxID=3155769 RepID=UPI0033C0C2BC